MNTSAKTRGEGPLFVNQRCEEASLSGRAPRARDALSSTFHFRLSFPYFDTLMNSFALDKTLTQMFSTSSTLFTQNTGGMGRPLRSSTSFTSLNSSTTSSVATAFVGHGTTGHRPRSLLFQARAAQFRQQSFQRPPNFLRSPRLVPLAFARSALQRHALVVAHRTARHFPPNFLPN